MPEDVQVQARFVYEGNLYGEWTDIRLHASMFPNACYQVVCVEFRAVGADGNMASVERQPRRNQARRARPVMNGPAR